MIGKNDGCTFLISRLTSFDCGPMGQDQGVVERRERSAAGGEEGGFVVGSYPFWCGEGATSAFQGI